MASFSLTAVFNIRSSCALTATSDVLLAWHALTVSVTYFAVAYQLRLSALMTGRVNSQGQRWGNAAGLVVTSLPCFFFLLQHCACKYLQVKGKFHEGQALCCGSF